MKVVELYGRVRYAVQIEGLSRREAARQWSRPKWTARNPLRTCIDGGHVATSPSAQKSRVQAQSAAHGNHPLFLKLEPGKFFH